MKSKLLFFLGAILVLSGCNKIKDAVSTTVNTNLQNNIPVVVTATKSANGTNTTAFSASQDLSLSDNADLQKYLSKINDIGLSNLVITITGLMENSQVKITDIAGNLICETVSNGSLATWDCKDVHGRRVSTGIYLAICANADGTQSAITKILVIN